MTLEKLGSASIVPILIFILASVAVLSYANFSYALNNNDETLASDKRYGPETESLAQERKITLQEAQEKIDWQNEAMKLNARLSYDQLFSSVYGGMWVGDDDRIKLAIVSSLNKTSELNAKIRELVSKYKLTEAVDFINVRYSKVKLTSVIDELSEQYSTLPRSGAKTFRIGFRASENSIVITSSHMADGDNSQKELVNFAKSKYGEMVKISHTTSRAVEAACDDRYCDSPLRGGVGINGSNDYSRRWCTLGFIVQGLSGQKYALTAAHCEDEGGSGWASRKFNGTLEPIGLIHRNLEVTDANSGIDAMIVKVSSIHDWTARGYVYIRSGTGVAGHHPPSRNETYDITGHSSNQGFEGQRVCMSGSSTAPTYGSSCGPVQDVNILLDTGGPYVNRGIVSAKFCGTNGDSGGPVTFQGNAMGIYTAYATNNASKPPCERLQFYTGMEPIIRTFDYTIDVI